MKYNRKAVTWEEPSTLHVTATMTTVVDCTGPTAQQGGKAARQRQGSSKTRLFGNNDRQGFAFTSNKPGGICSGKRIGPNSFQTWGIGLMVNY